MDQKKFGSFIASLRKEKGLTQAILAEELGVTNRTVSRWENGNYLPDISLYEELARCLGCSVLDLIKGEKTNESVSPEVSSLVVHTIQEERRGMKKRRKIFLVILSLLLILLVFTLLYFLHNYKKIAAYSFMGESERFWLHDGLVLYSNEADYIFISGIQLQDGYDDLDIYDFKIEVFFNQKLWASNLLSLDGVDSVNDELATITFSEIDRHYSSTLAAYEEDAFMASSLSDFPHQMEIVITYSTCENPEVEFKESLKIIPSRLVVSDQFFHNRYRKEENPLLYDANGMLFRP